MLLLGFNDGGPVRSTNKRSIIIATSCMRRERFPVRGKQNDRDDAGSGRAQPPAELARGSPTYPVCALNSRHGSLSASSPTGYDDSVSLPFSALLRPRCSLKRHRCEARSFHLKRRVGIPDLITECRLFGLDPTFCCANAPSDPTVFLLSVHTSSRSEQCSPS